MPQDHDSHDSHTTCRLDAQIAANKCLARLRDRASDGRDFDWLDDHPTALFEFRISEESRPGCPCRSKHILNQQQTHQVSISALGHCYNTGNLGHPMLPWLD